MDILTEFDELQEALKKVRIDEDVMIYHNGMLMENQETVSQMRKLLDCRMMENCHQYLYDCDPENFTEEEIGKIDKLYKLAVNRKYIDDGFNQELAADAAADAEAKAPVQSEPVTPPTPPKNYIPCWTILYSATDGNGNAKCGECFSNAISVQAAKADALAKLARFGYQNVAVLAIEAGDPDMCGCETPVAPAQPEPVVPEVDVDIQESSNTPAGDVEECDMLNNGFHNRHANDKRKIQEREDAAIPTSEIVGEKDSKGDSKGTTVADVLAMLKETDPDECILSEAEFENCIKLTPPKIKTGSHGIPDAEFFDIPMSEDDESGEAPAEQPTPEAPAEQPAEQPAAEAPAEQPAEQPAAEEAPVSGDDEQPAEDPAAEEAPVSGDDEQPAEEPAAEEAPAEEAPAEDSDADDSNDDGDDSEEDADEDSDDESTEKSDDDADAEKDELDDTQKAKLKDKYTQTFKTAMTSAGFEGCSFASLELDDQIKVLKAVKKEWQDEHQCTSDFMTDKQITQLNNVVIPEKNNGDEE